MRSRKELTSYLDKGIILDADIASAFAKIERLSLLKRFLSHYQVFITPRIYEELMVALDFKFTFPLDIFSSFELLHPSDEESERYRALMIKNRNFGRGELEAICICKCRGYVFSSMDKVALKFAGVEGVKTLKIHSILRGFWKSGIQSRDEVIDIIRALEEKDKTRVRNIDSIFK